MAMVEFRCDRSSDTAMLMEVNGRFWGTCSLALRAGLDLPYYVWQLAHGEKPEIRSTYLAGLRWRWYSGYLLRIDELLWNPRLDGQVRPPLWDEIGSSVRDLPPHAAAVWGHAAKDCGAPITSRIGEP